MNIISIQFIGFLFVTNFLYWLLNNKYKKYLLLIVSLLFCLSFGFKKLSFLLLYIIATYLFSKIVKNKLSLFICVFISIIPLLINKYLPSLNFSIIGISFVSFRAVSYIADKYKNRMESNSLIDYLIFMLFFPAFLSGPIEKPTKFIDQLSKERHNSFNQLVKSIFIFSYGYMMKIVIADRLILIINSIYNSSFNYGFYIIVAMFIYPIYIYADFAGYSYIAYGVSGLFGFEVTMNFKQPYLSTSINEFWNRWHVSLNNWLRDYIYIPLGGNRYGKFRKQINILIVFLISGIWHGTGFGFIVWGLLNAIYQIIGDYTFNLRNKLFNNFKFRKYLSIVGVYLLISFTWIFFSQGLQGGINALLSIGIKSDLSVTEFLLGIYESTKMSKEIIVVIAIAIMVVMIVDVLLKKDIDIVKIILNLNPLVRMLLLLILIIFNTYYGKYGNSADLSNFIYFNF